MSLVHVATALVRLMCLSFFVKKEMSLPCSAPNAEASCLGLSSVQSAVERLGSSLRERQRSSIRLGAKGYLHPKSEGQG